MRINIIPRSEFVRVRQAPQGYFAGQASGDELKKLTLIADMCRLNTLSAVKRRFRPSRLKLQRHGHCGMALLPRDEHR